MGFEPDEDSTYSFNDSSDIKYLNDAVIAVKRGWFSLSVGKFMPEQNVTSAEKDVIFADATVVWHSTEIDEDYNSTYQFKSGVVDIPDGTNVEEDENGVVKIYNNPKAITSGQDFVVYFEGMPKTYNAKSVSISGSVTTITTTEKEIGDILVAADAQGSISTCMNALSVVYSED